MTREEIDLLFPPEYSGNAQVSDLRLLLSVVSREGTNGIHFEIVNSIPERDQLTPREGHVCKVSNDTTYVYHEEHWVVLVETGNSGGPSPSGNKLTQNFTITTLDQDHGYVDLDFLPNYSDHMFIFLNGMYLILGVGYDCTIANNRLFFNPGVLNAGDHLCVKYTY